MAKNVFLNQKTGFSPVFKARDEGIEPPPAVLETVILPLYESRNH